jgi:mRNA interferase MazF
MRRGDLAVVPMPGDYGKPRPALVEQPDLFNDTHAGITVAPVSSTIVDTPLFRVTVEPSRRNGLRLVSQMMVVKVTLMRQQRLGHTIGCLEEDVTLRASRALSLWFWIAA